MAVSRNTASSKRALSTTRSGLVQRRRSDTKVDGIETLEEITAKLKKAIAESKLDLARVPITREDLA